MFTVNPFSDLSIPSAVMQGYVVLMIILVIAGTVIDMMHKKSAEYFFQNAEKAKKSAKRTLSGGEKASLAIQTVTNEVLTSSEFKNPKRRMSHLLMMYGFIIFVVTTAVLIFKYTSGDAAPSILGLLWHLGALMVAVGGYWFWFAIRVDVFAEGKKWYKLCQADIFIVSLMLTTTFALIWSISQSMGASGWKMLFFVLFVISSTTLFSTVLWSKFAHMFFKPAAAFQKKTIFADGSRENLPDLPSLTDPAVQAKFPDIPEYMGNNPPNMGLGIKREPANHY
jgi:hypothetical protein